METRAASRSRIHHPQRAGAAKRPRRRLDDAPPSISDDDDRASALLGGHTVQSFHSLSSSKSQIRLQPCSSPPCRGAKRRSYDLRRRHTTQICIPAWGWWGAKRARTSGLWRDWANLADGPLGLIAERVLAHDVADYIRFRAACRPWRHCAADPRAYGLLDHRFHPHRWIMLQEKENGHRFRRFLNVSTRQCIQMDLPDLQGCDVFGAPTTAGGLLVLVDKHTCILSLLNPFTRQCLELPPLTPVLPPEHLEELELFLSSDSCFQRHGPFDVLSAGLAGDSTVALYVTQPGMYPILVVTKLGEKNWTLIEDDATMFMPTISFAGRFYCATKTDVLMVETSGNQPPRLVVAAKMAFPFSSMLQTLNFVDIGEYLMLVTRNYMPYDPKRTYGVHRVDLDAGTTIPLCGLGGRAVFLGTHYTLSVTAGVFPTMKADTIYLGFIHQKNLKSSNILDGSVRAEVLNPLTMHLGISQASADVLDG